jgi:hypothetical protein
LEAGGLNRSGVFVSQALEGRNGERVFLAANPFYFGYEGVRIQAGWSL